jgi:hypothetical protein
MALGVYAQQEDQNQNRSESSDGEKGGGSPVLEGCPYDDERWGGWGGLRWALQDGKEVSCVLR